MTEANRCNNYKNDEGPTTYRATTDVEASVVVAFETIDADDVDYDNGDDEDNDVFPPLQQSHMGSTQRDLMFASQVIFFAVLYGSNAQASRSMRLSWVMLSLMIFLPRVMMMMPTTTTNAPFQKHQQRDTIILVCMGGFLYWLVLLARVIWLTHLLILYGLVIFMWQCVSLWSKRNTTTLPVVWSFCSSYFYHCRQRRKRTVATTTTTTTTTILNNVHVLSSWSSILAMLICIFLLPHYLSFHCALNAYLLQVLAAVTQTKMDAVAAAAAEDEDQKNVPPSLLTASKNNDYQHHLPHDRDMMSSFTAFSTSTPVILYSFNFARVNDQEQPHALLLHLLTTVMPWCLTIPIVLSLSLCCSCWWLPDADWISALAALTLYLTAWPVWLLTTEHDFLSLMWTKPLRLHVRSDASLVMESLAHQIIHPPALGAEYHQHHHHHSLQPCDLEHQRQVGDDDDDPRFIGNGVTSTTFWSGSPSPPLAASRCRQPRQGQRTVVLVELISGPSKFLRLAPEDPDGLIQAIRNVATVAAAKVKCHHQQQQQAHHSASFGFRTPVSNCPTIATTARASLMDLEMNATR